MAACKVCKKSEVSMLCICNDCFEELKKDREFWMAYSEKLVKEKEELQNQSDVLSDTVNMLSPSIMEIHELKTLNRELTEMLQAIRNDLAEHDYISTHTMRRLIEGVEQ